MNLSFPRHLSRETLDHLPGNDPKAVRARRDLQRINRLMGAVNQIARPLQRHIAMVSPNRGQRPLRIIELGAGDGSLMLRLAKRFAADWPAVHLTLLDRQNVVSASTRSAFQRLGWDTRVICADVCEWVASPQNERWDIALANLFVHHFDSSQITVLFGALGRYTDWFMACEPRRGHVPLLASRLVALAGAGAVTREDAVLSVQAGFSSGELSELWPMPSPKWTLQEQASGLFSHTFIASRLQEPGP